MAKLRQSRVKESYRRFLIHEWQMKVVGGEDVWLKSKYNSEWHLFNPRADYMNHWKWCEWITEQE